MTEFWTSFHATEELTHIISSKWEIWSWAWSISHSFSEHY